jgi:hypothetical protein
MIFSLPVARNRMRDLKLDLPPSFWYRIFDDINDNDS